MTPSFEQMLLGATSWRFRHRGVGYLLSHHGHRRGDEYPGASSHPGTWCYYLLVPEQMYPHRWSDFACVRDGGFEHPGPAWGKVEFDSEITWSSSEPYFDRKTDRSFDAVKVGCDYGHLWHHERDYPDTFESVKRDAIATVDRLLAAHPDCHVRSDYSGIWGEQQHFYIAVNGRLVHENDTISAEWAGWQRPSPASAEPSGADDGARP